MGLRAYAAGAGVNVKTVVADKAEQSHAAIAGHVHRQARRRADGGQNRYASGRGFLNQLKTNAAAYKQNPVQQRQISRQHLGADQLVQSVMAAHVFVQTKEMPLNVEQGRSVQASG